MGDVVVTVPKDIWEEWILEGDAAGEPPTGEEWGFYTYGAQPDVKPGDRCYIVAHGRLRGYAPMTRAVFHPKFPNARIGRVVFCRKADAVAVTIKAPIQGFRGWRNRWWDRNIEIAFPEWKMVGVGAK